MNGLIKNIVEMLIKALAPKEQAPKAPTSTKVNRVQNTSVIRHFEGCELTAYKCPAGVLTIGYGHTKTVTKGMVITKHRAEDLLRQDLEWCERAINTNVTVPLTQNQYDALASFIYNVGAGAFKKSTLLRKLNAGDYAGASAQFPRWNKGGGRVLRGLTRRRQAERELFDAK